MSKAMVALLALTTAASAQQAQWNPRSSCVAGIGEQFTNHEPYPVGGTYYRRPDGSVYYTVGSGMEKHPVDMACFAALHEKPPVVDEPPGF